MSTRVKILVCVFLTMVMGALLRYQHLHPEKFETASHRETMELAARLPEMVREHDRQVIDATIEAVINMQAETIGSNAYVTASADINKALAFARKKQAEANEKAVAGEVENFNLKREGAIYLNQ